MKIWMNKLSTFQKTEKWGKVSYQQSYPHYPHWMCKKKKVYIVKFETNVLYKTDKLKKWVGKIRKQLDFINVEI